MLSPCFKCQATQQWQQVYQGKGAVLVTLAGLLQQYYGQSGVLWPFYMCSCSDVLELRPLRAWWGVECNRVHVMATLHLIRHTGWRSGNSSVTRDDTLMTP